MSLSILFIGLGAGVLKTGGSWMRISLADGSITQAEYKELAIQVATMTISTVLVYYGLSTTEYAELISVGASYLVNEVSRGLREWWSRRQAIRSVKV